MSRAARFGALALFASALVVTRPDIAGAQRRGPVPRHPPHPERAVVVQLPAGKHRVEVSKSGYRQFTTEVDIREGEVMPLNVSLLTMP